jgi:hypothetical protein
VLLQDGFIDTAAILTKEGTNIKKFHSNTSLLARCLSLMMYKIVLNMTLKKRALEQNKNENPKLYESMRNQLDAAIIDVDQQIQILSDE